MFTPLLGAAADPASVLTTGTTAFEAASVLAVAIAGFIIVLRIIKKVRG